MVATTFCISGAVIAKAGSGMSSDLITKHIGTDFCIDTWIVQAESVINVASRNNWTDSYATLNNDVKKILEDTASAMAAIQCITYDMGNYNSRFEAEDMINSLRDAALRNISLLRDKKQQDFINGS